MLHGMDHCFVSDVDADQMVASHGFVRMMIRRKGDETEFVFRFPIGLAVFFVVVILACVTVTTQFRVVELVELAAVWFLVSFMCGLSLGMWSLLHRVAHGNANVLLDDLQRMSGSSESQHNGELRDAPERRN